MKSNLNTILLAITIGVLSWMGYTTQQNAEAIAVFTSTLSRFEQRMEQVVSRPEYETLAIEVQKIRARLAEIELELARLKFKLQ